MKLSVSARSSYPNLVYIKGVPFELSYIKDGIERNLSDEGWRKVQDVFIQNIQSEMGENFDFSSLQKVSISLDTHTLQAWNGSTSVFEKPSVCTRIAIATADQFAHIIEDHQTKKEEGKKNQQLRPPLQLPKPVKTPHLDLENLEDFERLILTDRKQAMAEDFLEKFGILRNESLAYYLSILSKKMNPSQILLEGEETKTVFMQQVLLDWANGNVENRFGKALTNLINTETESKKPVIYIPFNSPGHYQMIVIDRINEKIIGYDSKGHFNTDEQLKIIDQLKEIFGNYKFIGDEAFPIDHYDEIEGTSFPVYKSHQYRPNDEHCGIYVIHVIRQIGLKQKPEEIFQQPVPQETIQKIRKDCSREILRF